MDIFIKYDTLALEFFGILVAVVVIGSIVANIIGHDGILYTVISDVIIAACAVAIAAGITYASFCSVIHNTEQIRIESFKTLSVEQDLTPIEVGDGSEKYLIEKSDKYTFVCSESIQPLEKSVATEKAEVVYINSGDTPKLRIYYQYTIGTYLFIKTGEEKVSEPMEKEYTYVFYIPEGSIFTLT